MLIHLYMRKKCGSACYLYRFLAELHAVCLTLVSSECSEGWVTIKGDSHSGLWSFWFVSRNKCVSSSVCS